MEKVLKKRPELIEKPEEDKEFEAQQLLNKQKGNYDNFDISKDTQTHLKKVGYEYLFPIQVESYKHIFEGKDIIGKDRTGSGKTLAFSLPIIEKLRQKGKFKNERGQMPIVFILVPTRELANQVSREFIKLK